MNLFEHMKRGWWIYILGNYFCSSVICDVFNHKSLKWEISIPKKSLALSDDAISINMTCQRTMFQILCVYIKSHLMLIPIQQK